MKYVFVALVVVLWAFSANAVTKDLDKFSLLKCIDKSELVVVGTVQLLSNHERNNIVHDGGGMVTTDVTVRIDTLIKGEPNLEKNHVKFMIQGGTFFVPERNEVMTLDVSTEREFEVGEKVMLFIDNNNDL